MANGLLPLARRARAAARARLARVNREPVIVLGKEKSGTTAIAALLAEYTRCTVTLDIPALWGANLAAVRNGERGFDDVVSNNRLDFSRDIIKQPSMTYIYAEVRAVFPDAQLLMIVRDPRDNIRSVFNRMDVPGDLEDFDPRDADRLPKRWAWHLERPGILGLPGETYIEHAANRWNLAADVYLDNRDDMTVFLRYEDFIKDKAGAIASCAEALGLHGSRDISQSVDRQYQPRGKRNVTWLDFFGERNLDVIEGICADRMQSLGYRTGDRPKTAGPAAA